MVSGVKMAEDGALGLVLAPLLLQLSIERLEPLPPRRHILAHMRLRLQRGTRPRHAAAANSLAGCARQV